MVANGGLLFIIYSFLPGEFLITLFGSSRVNAPSWTLVAYERVLMFDMREILMPGVMNNFKLAEPLRPQAASVPACDGDRYRFSDRSLLLYVLRPRLHARCGEPATLDLYDLHNWSPSPDSQVSSKTRQVLNWNASVRSSSGVLQCSGCSGCGTTTSGGNCTRSVLY